MHTCTYVRTSVRSFVRMYSRVRFEREHTVDNRVWFQDDMLAISVRSSCHIDITHVSSSKICALT